MTATDTGRPELLWNANQGIGLLLLLEQRRGQTRGFLKRRGDLRALRVKWFRAGSPMVLGGVGFYVADDRSLRRSNLSLAVVSSHGCHPSPELVYSADVL